MTIGIGGSGRLIRAIRRSSPRKTFGRTSGGPGYEPERLIDQDLRPGSSRISRIREENRKRMAAVPIWIAVFALGLAVVAGLLFAVRA